MPSAMNLLKINDEIFYAQDAVITIGTEEINFLKDAAKISIRQRSRICTHSGPNDLIHEMFIGITSKSYIRPHKHLTKTESFYVIEGEVDVVMFDDFGNIVAVTQLAEAGREKNSYFKMNEHLFHTLVLRSECLILHEVTNGPFISDESLLASFSPPEDAKFEAIKYLSDLKEKVKLFYLNSGI
jgi:cupin fold WbuC family metalloprotein